MLRGQVTGPVVESAHRGHPEQHECMRRVGPSRLVLQQLGWLTSVYAGRAQGIDTAATDRQWSLWTDARANLAHSADVGSRYTCLDGQKEGEKERMGEIESYRESERERE